MSPVVGLPRWVLLLCLCCSCGTLIRKVALVVVVMMMMETMATDRRLAKRKAECGVLYELLVAFQVISAGPHPPVYRVFQGGYPALLVHLRFRVEVVVSKTQLRWYNFKGVLLPTGRRRLHPIAL